MFAFDFNLRRCTEQAAAAATAAASAATAAAGAATAAGAAASAAANAATAAAVGRGRLTAVESRVESAWFQLLIL
jgi:hypothetical protein